MAAEKQKPNLIIDEDWKTQVEREKEETDRAAAAQTATVEPAAGDQDLGIPPATLMTLLTTLGTQALLMLGQITHPVTNKRDVDLEQARHFIDLLAMLEVKTVGNRTDEESQVLDGLLHDLRLLFVQVSQKQ